MRPEDIPAEVVERAAFVAYAYTGCCVDCPDQQTRAEAEEDAATAARHILAAVWGEIQARALEDAANRMVLPGSMATGYYSSEAVSGYREAESDAEAWLRAEAERVRGDR